VSVTCWFADSVKLQADEQEVVPSETLPVPEIETEICTGLKLAEMFLAAFIRTAQLRLVPEQVPDHW
jgi:hypothetical protein